MSMKVGRKDAPRQCPTLPHGRGSDWGGAVLGRWYCDGAVLAARIGVVRFWGGGIATVRFWRRGLGRCGFGAVVLRRCGFGGAN
jgi:hypothetical protein